MLKVGPNGISAGNAAAAVDSTLKAVAEGVGSLNLGLLGGTTPVNATVTGEGKVSKDLTCATPGLPAPLDSLLTVGVACGSAVAEVANGQPSALALGKVMALDLKVNNLLNLPLGSGLLDPVLGLLGSGSQLPVGGLLDTLEKTIGNLTGGIVPELGLDDTLGGLLEGLQSQTTLSVRIGDATSSVQTSGGAVTSKATAAGGIIELLPISLPLVDGTIQIKPLIQIIIGSSSASASYNRGQGSADAAFDAAIATVNINLPLLDDLGTVVGIDLKSIKIAPDLSILNLPGIAAPCADAANETCVLPGTPLETRIAIASGRTVNNPDGTIGAVADAVKIHALKNIGQLVAPLTGGILLEIGHSAAGVGGKPAELVSIPEIIPELPRELPRTGGVPWMPMIGAAGLAAAIITRRTLARSH
ncbi:MAG TPA: hypothetical protein VFO65_02540 [Acidimicrobiales bacterium]|nr:hypothetical protein [Acidimicrobiales bacterium]